MVVEFNHTIVDCTDKDASARFLAYILGLGEPGCYGPFAVVQLGNGTTLDFAEGDGQPHRQHYAARPGQSDAQCLSRRQQRSLSTGGRQRFANDCPRRRANGATGGCACQAGDAPSALSTGSRGH